jgi:hypothetical protein
MRNGEWCENVRMDERALRRWDDEIESDQGTASRA